MVTKIETPLARATKSGKIVNGVVVGTKKSVTTAKKVPPVEKLPKEPKEPKERKLTAKALIAQMILAQTFSDDEITAACLKQFPDTFKRAYISCTRSDINNARIHQKEAAGRIFSAVYKDESGKILKERPVKEKKVTETKEPAVKKTTVKITKKTLSTSLKE